MMKRKRLPRLAALTIVMLLVIQSLPALAFDTNPTDTSGGGYGTTISADSANAETVSCVQSESDQAGEELSSLNVSSQSENSESTVKKYEISIEAVDASNEDQLLKDVTLEIVKGTEDTEEAVVAATITTTDSADNLAAVKLEPGYYLLRNTNPASEYSAEKTVSFYICSKGNLFVLNPQTNEYEYEKSKYLKVACSKAATAPLLKASNDVIEDEYTMQHFVAYCALGQIYHTQGAVYAYHNVPSSCGDSRAINYFAYLSVAHDGKNDVYGKVNDLVSEKDPDDIRPQVYGSLVFPRWTISFEKENNHQYTFGDELLEWGKSKGYDWTEDTVISDVSMDLEYGVKFTDDSGKETELLDTESSNNTEPEVYNYWSADSDSFFSVSDPENSDFKDTASSVIYKEYGYSFKHVVGTEIAESFTFSDFPNMKGLLANSSVPYISYKYSGSNVTVNCLLNYTFSFKVTDEQGVEHQYKVTLKTPEINPTFNITKGDGRHLNVAGGDISATVKSQNGGTEIASNTESDKITAVRKGNVIDYSIDLSGDAERQMLTWFYTEATIHSVVPEKVEPIQVDDDRNNNIYFGYWSQPCAFFLTSDKSVPSNLMKPRLKVTFTLPEEGLEAPDGFEDNITITSDKPDVASWEIDKSLTSYNADTRTVTVYVSMDPLDIPQPDPMNGNGKGDDGTEGIINIGSPWSGGLLEGSQEKIQKFLADLDGNKVHINIPGIKVRSDAKINTPYTAKATVRGNMIYSAFPYEMFIGNPYGGGGSGPLGSKEGTFDPEDADDIWDDSDEDSEVFSASAQSSSSDTIEVQAEDSCDECGKINPKREKKAQDDSEFMWTGFYDYESDDTEIWTPDMYEPYDPSGVLDLRNYESLDLCYNYYYWDYVQTAEGKDCIQDEDYSREMWYTVIIPAATISKELPDDASDADRAKEFTFGIQLKDEDLFGQEFDAARGVKQDDGSISYNSTETVTFDENGYAEIKLKAGEVLAIGLPDGCEYNVKEILEDDSYTVEYSYVSASGDETVSTGTYYNNDGIDAQVEAAKYTESDSADTIDVTATNYPEGNLAISKRLTVPEEELAAEENKEFSFVLTLDNDDFDVNRDYTVKLYSDGVYNSSLGRFEYQDDPAEETMTIKDGKLSFSLKHGQTIEIDGLPDETSYTVEEVVNHGFTPSYKNQSGTVQAHETTYALCENTYDYNETTDITVNKVWVGDTETTRPASVQAQLYRNGKTYGDPVTLKKSNDWSHTWTGLDANQKYTVDEVNVPDGYESSVTNKNNVWTITNTNQNTVTPDTQSVKVNKVWANDDSSTRPSSVKMQLYQNGSVYGDAVTLSETNNWSYTWTGLESGKNYTVAEVNVPDGYESSVSNKDNVWTVTNTKKDTTTPDKQSVKVNKVWANDDSSTRPSSVQMQLYQNGSVYGDAVTLSETNDWSYTWTGLEADQEYTVAEVNVPDGYESSVTSTDNVWTVTNTKKGTDTPSDETTNTPGNPSNTTTNTPSNTTTNTTTNNNSEPAEAANASPAKTGDTSRTGIWLLIILAASAGAIFAVWKKRADR
jgi:hypothetical protein